MKLEQLRRYIQREGWLLAALLICTALCLLLGSFPQASSATEEEKRIARILSAMEGAGQVEVALHTDADSLPCSAVVVADGAQDVAVRIRLTQAMTTLLGIDADRVVVYQRSQGGS